MTETRSVLPAELASIRRRARSGELVVADVERMTTTIARDTDRLAKLEVALKQLVRASERYMYAMLLGSAHHTRSTHHDLHVVIETIRERELVELPSKSEVLSVPTSLD